jgi:hypothetical protein
MPSDPPEEQAEEEEASDGQDNGDGEEEAHESPPRPDLFRRGRVPFGRVLRMESVTELFGPNSGTFASQRSGRGFVARLFGPRIGVGQVDAILLGDLLTLLGRATAWINNALAGKRTVPGVEYAAALSSVVVQFAASSEEEVYPEDERVVTPTAITGDWMASLLLSDEGEILKAVKQLRPRASGTYLKALEELAEQEIEADWLVLDQPKPRLIRTSKDSILETIEVLDQPVKMRTRRVPVVGILYAADQYGHTFKMDVIEGELAGKTIRGTYGPTASETLEGAWRKSVDATIRIREAAQPGLPRAPRTTYELERVREILDQAVPPEPQTLWDLSSGIPADDKASV